jgi:stage IV sporulation protein FB
MVRFTLFRVPVEIQPWFWVTAALLGGALNAATPEALRYVVIFIFASTISILVHEYGHALVGRRLGGGHPAIVLWAFGGLAYNEGGRFTKWSRFWMTAAGPGAGLALALVVLVGLIIAVGPSDALSLAGRSLFGILAPVSETTANFFSEHPPLFTLIRSLLWINFWWSLINLLPVIPLDGGRIAEIFVKPQSRVYQLAITASVAMALVGALWMQSLYTTFLFGYLAWKNFQSLKELTTTRW